MRDRSGKDLAQRIAGLLPAIASAQSPGEAALAEYLGLARQAMQAGRGEDSVNLLRALWRHRPGHPEAGRLLGFALRQEQRLSEADAVFSETLQSAPDAPALLFGQAQTRFELGLPAAALFAKVQAAMPGDADAVRNRAAAMAAEGDRQGAEALLLAAVRAQPGWLDGHKVLASLRWTGGDAATFAASYAEACAAEPDNAALWLAWFAAVAQTRDWPASRAILDRAERRLGATPGILAARLFVAVEADGGEGEAGGGEDADALLAATAHIRGDAIALCRIRHALRRHRPDQAQAVVAPLLSGPSAALFWPYQSLVWRLAGDDRHYWLDRPGHLIQSAESGLSIGELEELAGLLRSLHTMAQPYPEQTVRGGTQTDRSVLLRREPILQRTRDAWMEAVRSLIAGLPAPEEGHPLLGRPRGHLLLGGSWSVRLAAQGSNVPHTHPLGWLSSSLYVAIPGEGQRGPAPAGHIIFGAPPPELGLDLPPYRTIAPQPGMVVTFPSTMWHAVAPFAEGERLMIALDIRPPDY